MPQTLTCLGLHVGHDRAITIVQDGQITFHIAVERLDRRKHSDSPDLPIEVLHTVLNRLGIGVESIGAACVTYHGVEANRITATVEQDFRAAFPAFRGTFSALDHHLAHALGALACSPFDEALVLVADGAGDLRSWGSQAESLFYVSRKNFYLLAERLQDRPSSYIHRPEFFDPSFFSPDDQKRQISLGLKYEQLTYLCGFGPGQAGQTMALSAYGTPLIDVDSCTPTDFGFSLRYPDLLDRMGIAASRRRLTLRQFARTHAADIAATAQAFLQKALVSLVDHVVTEYSPANLCFAGGVFLNCLTNREITDRHAGRGLFFLPACHDEGQSLGAAAHAWWELTAEIPRAAEAFPYLGIEYSQEECEAAMRGAGLAYEVMDDDHLASTVAKLIASGKICALLRGRSETGPRALGHRSILGDPRSPQTKERLDRSIKRRAEFRPYAPMVLASEASEFFTVADASPYMLLTAHVRPERHEQVPVVVNVDGTARIQTVGPEDDKFIWNVLSRFERRTGVPVLLNTSFNDESEPMVEAPTDAVRTFQRTELDALVLGSAIHIRPGS